MENYSPMESEFGSLEHDLYKLIKLWKINRKNSKYHFMWNNVIHGKQKLRDHPPWKVNSRVCIEKSPDRSLSEYSSTIVVLLREFCKMLWYCSILFILNQSGQLWIKQKKKKINKITILFTVLNLFFKALKFNFWQFSQNFDFVKPVICI